MIHLYIIRLYITDTARHSYLRIKKIIETIYEAIEAEIFATSVKLSRIFCAIVDYIRALYSSIIHASESNLMMDDETYHFKAWCRHRRAVSQQTLNIDPMLGQCCAGVGDGGPTLTQDWLNASCLLAYPIHFHAFRSISNEFISQRMSRIGLESTDYWSGFTAWS